MDTILKFLLGIFFVSYVTCVDEEGCKIFTCGELPDGVCGAKNGIDFIYRRCEGDNKYCKFETQDEGLCETNPKVKSYPGGTCQENNDCIVDICINNKCEGNDEGENCTHHGECVIGKVCRKNPEKDEEKICLPPLEEGETCTEDEDCHNSCGCFLGKCTKYFSQEDETPVPSKYFCKSGFELNKICTTIYNIEPKNQPCSQDEDCKYKFQNKTDVPLITDACKCGYNKDSNKYCLLGSGDELYKNWINSTLTLLNDTSNCHTAERENLGICVERTLTDRTFAYRKTAKYAQNNQTLIENFPKIANTDSCVKSVAFSSYDDSIVKPDSYQCPRYHCTKKQESCLVSYNPFNEDGSGISINLSRFCTKNETCAGNEIIFNEDSVSGKCMPRPPLPIMHIRLPGEECETNEKCIVEGAFKSSCDNGKCTGQELEEECLSTLECVAGLYCDNVTKRCKPQVTLGENCTDIYDCANHLGCYEGKCVELGKLNEGDELSFEKIGEFSINPKKSLFCQLGQVSFEDGDLCAVHKYTDKTAESKNSDGYVKCNLGEKCIYTDGQTKYARDCECGYNSDGQGYCPISMETSI
jgi:hypothetical protein